MGNLSKTLKITGLLFLICAPGPGRTDSPLSHVGELLDDINQAIIAKDKAVKDALHFPTAIAAPSTTAVPATTSWPLTTAAPAIASQTTQTTGCPINSTETLPDLNITSSLIATTTTCNQLNTTITTIGTKKVMSAGFLANISKAVIATGLQTAIIMTTAPSSAVITSHDVSLLFVAGSNGSQPQISLKYKASQPVAFDLFGLLSSRVARNNSAFYTVEHSHPRGRQLLQEIDDGNQEMDELLLNCYLAANAIAGAQVAVAACQVVADYVDMLADEKHLGCSFLISFLSSSGIQSSTVRVFATEFCAFASAFVALIPFVDLGTVGFFIGCEATIAAYVGFCEVTAAGRSGSTLGNGKSISLFQQVCFATQAATIFAQNYAQDVIGCPSSTQPGTTLAPSMSTAPPATTMSPAPTTTPVPTSTMTPTTPPPTTITPTTPPPTTVMTPTTPPPMIAVICCSTPEALNCCDSGGNVVSSCYDSNGGGCYDSFILSPCAAIYCGDPRCGVSLECIEAN